MNRFRSRKKSRAGEEPARRPLNDSDVPALPSFTSMSFTKSRKAQTEPEPVPRTIDLSTALPSNDDFRMSLMMPIFSARFSMLREQDDPNSKLGKANDDSVLFPKRASRLKLFNHHDLTDIAEAASMDGSIRPPFACGARTASYGSGDGYGTDDDSSHNGSMMGRPKLGEGNNLFGGRQKIYKIPLGGSGSVKNLGTNDDGDVEASKTMGGKALYGDDVATSAFQKLRQKEREEQEEQARTSQEDGTQNEQLTTENERPSSPLIAGYNRNRETTSSTASGPSNIRTSTGATSVASQSAPSLQGPQASPSVPFSKPLHSPGLDRSSTKTRRLYGQGLDQHMLDQQSSALTRLDSIHRQRAIGGTAFQRLSQSRSATGLNDKFRRSGSLYTSNTFRAASPAPYAPQSGVGEFDLGLGNGRSITAETAARPRSPTLSQPKSPVIGVGDKASPLASALEPNDRGKATALGAFNKPSRQYSEQQYAERQLQLQSGRATPSQGGSSSPPTVFSDTHEIGRPRKASLTSFQSRSESSPHPPESHLNEPVLRSMAEVSRHRANIPHSDRQSDEDATFLAGTSGSDLSSEAEDEAEHQSGRPIPDEFKHESLEQTVEETTPMHHLESREGRRPLQQRYSGQVYMDLSEEPVPDSLSQKTVMEPRDDPGRRSAMPDAMDSPTLGPTTGLSGLIKAHLRNDSGQSSIYPPESPVKAARSAAYNSMREYPVNHERAPSGAGNAPNNDAREAEQWNGELFGVAAPEGDASMPPSAYSRARQILDQATALRNHESDKAKQMLGDNKAQRILGGEAPRPHPYHSTSWQDQVKGRHSRGASTETQHEREDFANELAERRKRVQDNLAGFVNSESGSASPVPSSGTTDNGPAKPSNAFSMLRSKSSQGSLHYDKNSKAMKMLGITDNPLPSVRSSIWSDGKERALRGLGQGPKSPSNFVNAAFHIQKTPPGSRAGPEKVPSGGRGNRPIHSGPSPPSSRSSERDRSSPEGAMGKWRNRNGRVRDEVKKADIAAARERMRGSPPRKHSEGYGLPAETGSNHQAAASRFSSAMPDRLRSNSKANNAPGYFDRNSVLPVQTNISAPIGHSQRPSPPTPRSPNSSPPQQVMAPSAPGMNSPTVLPSQAFSTASVHIPSARKRSVNKLDISEPTFMSSTSSVTTINLPPGASLSNGAEPASAPPPLPPINPRRNRPKAAAHNIRNVFGRRGEETVSAPMTPYSQDESHVETSTFPEDGESQHMPRQKLRKPSSEGGDMNAKALQQAVVSSPTMAELANPRVTGAMF
ncbi:hypothetical protein MMC08_004471 [Hypocenomyce scalaris]|nr:hypothetical protein [Hypocenomyce scalaris]